MLPAPIFIRPPMQDSVPPPASRVFALSTEYQAGAAWEYSLLWVLAAESGAVSREEACYVIANLIPLPAVAAEPQLREVVWLAGDLELGARYSVGGYDAVWQRLRDTVRNRSETAR